MDDDESKNVLKMIDGHVGRLKEQGFDTVQIFCSKSDGANGTRYWENGGGNFLARFGQVFLWLEKEKSGESRRETDA